MKKNGFTLIELLGVIIILGIIVTVVSVTITSKLEKSHTEATKNAAYNVLKGAQSYYTDYILENGSFEYVELDIKESKDLLDLNGGLPDSGYVKINPDSSATVYYVRYGLCVIASTENSEARVSKNLEECSKIGGNDGPIVDPPVNPPVEPTNAPSYLLENTTFDGIDDWYDTGYSLFDTTKDFTIITSFMFTGGTPTTKNPATLFHCMHEVFPWAGLGFDYMYARGSIALKTRVTNPFPVNILNTKLVIALKRDTTANVLNYYIFNASGNLIATNILSKMEQTNFDQHLIVGAYQDASGVKGRFFQGTIYNFSLYMEALSDEKISQKMTELK